MELDNDAFLTFYLRIDKKYNHYKRTVFSASEIIAKLGGIQTILLTFGIICTKPGVTHLFRSSIMRRIYSVEYPENEKKKGKKSKREKSLSNIEEATYMKKLSK